MTIVSEERQENENNFLAETEGQNASLFTDGFEGKTGIEVIKKPRLNKTERKFKKYQEKLARYKVKKEEKKRLKAEKQQISDDNSSEHKQESNKKPRLDASFQADEKTKDEEDNDEDDDREDKRTGDSQFLSKRDAKKLCIERMQATYAPKADLSTYLKVYFYYSFIISLLRVFIVF
jgi:hypothetical protein